MVKRGACRISIRLCVAEPWHGRPLKLVRAIDCSSTTAIAILTSPVCPRPRMLYMFGYPCEVVPAGTIRGVQAALSGSAKVVMLLTVSPATADAHDTLSSMTFASRLRGLELGPAHTGTRHVRAAAEAAAAPAEDGTPAAGADTAAAAAQERERLRHRVTELQVSLIAHRMMRTSCWSAFGRLLNRIACGSRWRIDCILRSQQKSACCLLSHTGTFRIGALIVGDWTAARAYLACHPAAQFIYSPQCIFNANRRPHLQHDMRVRPHASYALCRSRAERMSHRLCGCGGLHACGAAPV